MLPPRAAGVLLHPSALPSRFGIGDFGPEARRFLDFLAAARMTWWQVLPLGPTGYGDSPYAALSSFAGNPLLVSPEALLDEGLVSAGDLPPERPRGAVDFDAVIAAKAAFVARAHERFAAEGTPPLRAEFERFRRDAAPWLGDFALFLALKERYAGRSWLEWERRDRLRDRLAVASARRDLALAIERHSFAQFLFHRQWESLRALAREKGIRVAGDVPIFAALDSADVWARRDLFQLDAEGRPTAVSGVPPDYFSETGQLWGNPLYEWKAHAADGFSWWIERLRSALARFDAVRLDHFRGFEAAWEVPAGEPTAVNGKWAKGPGGSLFAAVRKALGQVDLWAEDLGVITAPVWRLRDRFHLPGMKVLQFAFGDDAKNPFLPHNYAPRCVAYTGTHDNAPTRAWFAALPPAERARVLDYAGTDGRAIERDAARLLFASVAATVILPAADVIGAGAEARVNTPGKSEGNWRWRLSPGEPSDEARDFLARLARTYGREPAALA